jgi:hypothetical protein
VRRNLTLMAMSLIFAIGLTSGAFALNHPVGFGWGGEKDDHTWGGEQGFGPGTPMESSRPQTGILFLDIVLIRLAYATPIHLTARPVAIIKVDTQQGESTESWTGEQSFSDVRGN